MEPPSPTPVYSLQKEICLSPTPQHPVSAALENTQVPHGFLRGRDLSLLPALLHSCTLQHPHFPMAEHPSWRAPDTAASSLPPGLARGAALAATFLSSGFYLPQQLLELGFGYSRYPAAGTAFPSPRLNKIPKCLLLPLVPLYQVCPTGSFSFFSSRVHGAS